MQVIWTSKFCVCRETRIGRTIRQNVQIWKATDGADVSVMENRAQENPRAVFCAGNDFDRSLNICNHDEDDDHDVVRKIPFSEFAVSAQFLLIKKMKSTKTLFVFETKLFSSRCFKM